MLPASHDYTNVDFRPVEIEHAVSSLQSVLDGWKREGEEIYVAAVVGENQLAQWVVEFMTWLVSILRELLRFAQIISDESLGYERRPRFTPNYALEDFTI